jgi:hypothetical protein
VFPGKDASLSDYGRTKGKGNRLSEKDIMATVPMKVYLPVLSFLAKVLVQSFSLFATSDSLIIVKGPLEFTSDD